MYLMRISSHEHLQALAQKLTDLYHHDDPFILRAAVLEVLQNTLQHSDGRFGLLLTVDSIIITSLPKSSTYRRYSLGLKLYGGISVAQKGELFISHIMVPRVYLKSLDIDEVLESCSLD
jgi:hypothetical protein